MPEIKKSFSAGRMNKDVDERLLPNGEYRDAMNIQVRTTDTGDGEFGDAGSVQNIKGNREISANENIWYETPITPALNTPNKSKVVGSVANEKNNKAYFMVAAPDLNLVVAEIEADPDSITSQKLFIDYIVEVDTGVGTQLPSQVPVVVDRWAVVDTAANVLTEDQINGVLDGNFITFNVKDGTQYRIGMTVMAINTNGTNMFNEEAVIHDINSNTIVLQTEQLNYYEESSDFNYIDFLWTDVVTFVFEHKDRVLNFHPEERVNGINVIDDLLFWTDNRNEPKKINITRSKSGTANYTSHTQLKLKNPIDSDVIYSFTDLSGTGEDVGDAGDYLENSLTPLINNDLKEEHVTVIRRAPLTAPTLKMSESERSGQTTIQSFPSTGLSFDNNTGITPGQIITGISSSIILNNAAWIDGDILKFEELTIDAGSRFSFTAELDGDPYTQEDSTNVSINVIVKSISGSITGGTDFKINLVQRKPLFELKMGRFGYRYKYEDNEYSSFSPWSELAFLPGPFDYSHKKGYNLGMVNNVRELIIKDFLPHQSVRPDEVCAVDILWKTTDSPNIYVVKTINRGIDPEWKLFSTSSPALLSVDTQKSGELTITSEMIHKVLPENQLLRAWDNVPRFALSQEVAANRIVYANYTQGYDINYPVSLKQTFQNDQTASMEKPKKSVKTIREYKFGMVFGDKYGRETPVISSGNATFSNEIGEWIVTDGGITLEKQWASFQNRFKLQQNWNNGDEEGDIENWMEYVKYYVKETSSEYYNLIMDRWYYAEDGNLWISFPSADRNKLDQESYIILKNEHGTNTPVTEKARYKVIAIENEAPDDIKRDPRPMGKVTITSPGESDEYMFSTGSALTNSAELLEVNTEMKIASTDWDGFLEGYVARGQLQMRVTASGSTGAFPAHSEGWQDVTYISTPDDGSAITIKWKAPFGDFADVYSLATADGGALTTFVYSIEFREVVVTNLPEFDGKFFVKIEQDAILKGKVMKVEEGEFTTNITKTWQLSYIDSRRENPAADSSAAESNYYNDTYMPRRNYTFLNDAVQYSPTNYPSGEEVATSSGYGDGPDDNTTNTNISGVVTEWRDSGSCQCKEAKVHGDDEYHTGGCFPIDAEFLGLGCRGNDDRRSGNVYYHQGQGPIINRAGETADFWRWHHENAVPFLGGSRLFIDSIRGKRIEMNQSILNSEGIEVSQLGRPVGLPTVYLDGTDSDDDEIVNADNEYTLSNQNANTDDNGFSWFTPEYYKPTGIDQGVLSNLIGATEEFNPTQSGQLGRIVISVLNMGGAWGWSGENEASFRTHMTTQGNLFRFTADPTKSVYKIVSAPIQVDTVESGRNSANQQDIYRFGRKGHGEWGMGLTYQTLTSSVVNDGWDLEGEDPSNPSSSTFPTVETPETVHVGGSMRTADGNYNTDICANFSVWDVDFPSGEDHFFGGFPYLPDFGPCSGNSSASNYDEECLGSSSSTGTNGYAEPGPGVCCVCNDSGDGGYPECSRTSFRVEFRRCKVDSIELDSVSLTGDQGIDTDLWDPRGAVCHDGRETIRIAAVGTFISPDVTVIPVADAACWETEPRESIELDIYYEASNAIPMRLSSNNTPNYAPYGSKVSIKSYSNGSYIDEDISSFTINAANYTASDFKVSHIGYTKENSIVGITMMRASGSGEEELHMVQNHPKFIKDNYIVFEHPDGTRTMSKIVDHMIPVNENGTTMTEDTSATYTTAINDFSTEGYDDTPVAGVTPTKQTVFKINDSSTVETSNATGYFKLDSDVYKYPIELSWHNCWSFGNGVESDRIRDDFNAPQIDNGVKVSTTFLDYGRERRGSGLIYSGIYNSTSGINDLNEFNMAEKITKDINPSYGSIQALKTRDTDVVILTEDKVLKAVTNKDALYNADGNPQLIASNRVLGTAVPFSGDYGISNNPESLASDQYRLYFTDMQRGAVLRLSRDGLTPISDAGMKTWFRDNLKKTNSLLGTFDSVSGEYNLTFDYITTTNLTDKTVSFNESSKGWVSFKSFVPQEGVSVGGRYLTASLSGNTSGVQNPIWEHHVDIRKAAQGQNFNDIINRNVFYATNTIIQAETNLNDYHTNSSLTMIFNDIPGSIKSFKAANYEGSQARVREFINTSAAYVTPDGTDFSNQNDGEYYNLKEKEGWWVNNITTDSTNKGEILEFIEKEGKWFNRISGADRGSINNKDLNDFSVQGIGNLQKVEAEVVDDPKVTIKISSDMVDDAANTPLSYEGEDGLTYTDGSSPV